jgi:hypothetical protein
MTGTGLLLMMLCAVLLAMRAAEIASERMHLTLLAAFPWIGLAVASFMVLMLQWVAYLQLPAGGGL